MKNNQISWWHYKPLGPVVGKNVLWWKYQKTDWKRIFDLYTNNKIGFYEREQIIKGKYVIPLLLAFGAIIYLFSAILKP